MNALQHPTRSERLIALLADGHWHTQREMQRAGGLRYGARLHAVHLGGVMHYETRTDEHDTSRVDYRAATKRRCDICSDPEHVRPSEELARLRQENAKLREHCRKLEAACAQ